MENKIPRFLYRYEKTDLLRIETIGEKKLWFSNPEEFNDPLDCRLFLNWSINYPWTKKKLLEVFNDLYFSSQNSQVKNFFNSDVLKSIKEFLEERNHSELKRELKINFDSDELQQLIYKKVRACCFCGGDPSNPLMWAHYGVGHTGFCVKYEVVGDDSDQIQTMNYSSTFPEISLAEFLLNQEQVVRRVLNNKHVSWSHEEEFRIIDWESPNDFSLEGIKKPIPSYLKVVQIIGGVRFPGKEDNAKKCESKLKEIAKDFNNCSFVKMSFDKHRLLMP